MNHEEDKSMDVIFIGLLAIIHSGFWLGIGLAAGKLLWGI